MSTSWIPFLEMCDQVNRMHISDTKWLDEINSEKYEIYFRRLASYFIYRYFMKAVFDLDVAGKIKFAVLSTYMILLLARCTIELTGQCDFEDLALLAKNYSKEIEYSEENLEKLM
jgi:lysine-N-methylase